MIFSQYLAELKHVQILLPAEEHSLWRSFKEEGNLESRRRLIESYQPLVFKTAAHWRLSESAMLDIIQEGTVGLIEAVENFDHTRGVAFSLFAVHRIKGRIVDHLKREDSGLVHIDSPLNDAAGQATIADLLVDAQAEVAAQAEQNYLVEQLKTAMQRLPAKEQQVLHGVFLDDFEPKELADSMSLSVSHVYRLQKQGIRRLRGMLSKLMGNW
ncbi:sigma-70 family RNA polymerase sigma factor [Sporomusa acidovorans]|uniref:RNA polymerase sigma-E factor n=1 Tax=Sporomusa acidovorans (strain ATCC 49682 / DSM 3132 / Mol) TaxID=1123286 RepID=A0ABZ3J740_SPOA4|nr:sigma-70 family RNA polymerase sigma factor [Sporomusa acidovorans]OZC19281.1 RNA polymerase sigma-E factor precursor [Sporomusa acidovorans DSM 3132]SDD81988.1 RNA polymerase sporulation-specific sigma factor [Sporomusa acidovorans]